MSRALGRRLLTSAVATLMLSSLPIAAHAEDPSEVRDPALTYVEAEHLDLGTYWSDEGELKLFAGSWKIPTKRLALDKNIWLGRGEQSRFTVPDPGESGTDLRFLGEPGATYYGFPASGSTQATYPWPGLTAEGMIGTYEHAITWELKGFADRTNLTDPGKFFAFSSRHVFSSEAGYPRSTSLAGSHSHFNWAFTKPGVYCLDLQATLRKPGASENTRANGIQTVVVGEIPTTGITPCTKDDVASLPTPAVDEVGSSKIRTNVSASTDISPALTPDGLDIVADTSFGLGPQHNFADVEDVFFNVNDVASWGYWRNGPGVVTFDHNMLNADKAGDLTISLGDVVGGDKSFRTIVTSASQRNKSFLDARPDQELRTNVVRQGQRLANNFGFDRAGVYCVPLRFSGEYDGATYDLTKMLTFLVGSENPASPSYIDREEVTTTCADGLEPSALGEAGDKELWVAENGSTNGTGATILNDGHVDLASTLDEGAWNTLVKDSATSDEPIWREPQSVILQAKPGSRMEVPDVPAYAFLGAPGSAAWVLPEVQEDGLLWPGWSTETLPSGSVDGDVTWSLDRVRDGFGGETPPGEVKLYQSDSGGPHVLFDTGDEQPDVTEIGNHSHVHGNWAFTAEGAYCIDFTRSARLSATGERTTDNFTVLFAVGKTDIRDLDPSFNCLAPTEVVATTVTAAPVKQVYGKTTKLKVAVSPKATGQVSVKVGSRTVTGTLADGQATVTLPAKALRPGSRSVSISYAGVADAFGSSNATARVTVAKAKPAVKIKRVSAKVKRGKTAAFRVSVTAAGVRPTGKVTVKIGSKRKIVRLTANGTALVKIKLPKAAKPGRRAVSVTYAGDTYVATGSSNTRIRVTR